MSSSWVVARLARRRALASPRRARGDAGGEEGVSRKRPAATASTPRSIYQLAEMGFDFGLAEFHRVDGLRAYAGELMIEMEWPEHPVYPNWGGVIRRADLDEQVARLAEKQGVVVRQHTSAVPVLAEGRIAAVELTSDGEKEMVHPRFVVVADGSLAFRACSRRRPRQAPPLRTRGTCLLPQSDVDRRVHGEPVEPARHRRCHRSRLRVGLPNGRWHRKHRCGCALHVPPVEGSQHLDTHGGNGGFRPAALAGDRGQPGRRGRGGKLPMSFSVGPLVGRNWLLVGDAAGAINPFNGEGIAYAYETGRIAARHIGAALGSEDPARLWGYHDEIHDTYDLYFRVARAFVAAIGRPGVMKVLTRTGLRNRTIMEWTLRVMSNLMRPDERHLAETAYGVIETLVKMGPEP